MVEVKVNPGICGLESVITFITEETKLVNVKISSECPSIKKMENELTDIDCLQECFSNIGNCRVYKAADKYCKHAACPVPAAIMKGLEVAGGLALPKDVEIKIINNKE